MNTLLILMTCLSADVVFDPAEADALLTEPKSQSVQGKRLSEQKLYDDARVRFREEAHTDEERAAAEYNVGRTLTLEAATLKSEGSQGDPEEVKAEMQKRYDLAAETFERAYGMSEDKSFQAESALAAGNARLSQGDLKKAVENYRRSMVAKANPRARDNLGRALRAMRAQPPPPPSEDDEQKEGEEGEEGEESEEQKPGEPSEDNKESEEKDAQKEGEQSESKDEQGKDEQEPKEGDEKEQQDKEGEDKDAKEDEKKGEDKEGKDKKGEDKEGKDSKGKDSKGKGEADKPESQSKKDAREMLDALRSKERPIGPMEMRDQKARKRPRSGKDW